MRRAVLLLILALAGLAGADKKPAPSASPKPAVLPAGLPVIEVNQPSTPETTSNTSLELKPIEGKKPDRLVGKGIRYWGGPYGMPAGPGRAWPNAGPPGNSGPAGGVLAPGVPGRI